jgi:serine/threonine-protein kinase HipA
VRSLQVSIEINGAQTQIGTIEGNNAADACFQYAENYCENPDAAAVSISLPVRMGKYSPKETKNFFEGLLPEGFTRRSVAQWMHVDEEDYLSILAGLGNECLGAVRIRENSCAAEAGYRKLSKKQVAELAGEGAEKSAELVMRSTSLTYRRKQAKRGCIMIVLQMNGIFRKGKLRVHILSNRVIYVCSRSW